MLPALAGDERVIAMFRKEARTLTKFHHEALVNYRVLAQEPDLHVLYIVTDFIAGTPLSTAMGTLKATPDDLARLLRRLAAGLASAHELGAMIQRLRPEHPHFDGPPWQEAVRSAGGWSAPREVRVTTAQPTDPEQIVAYVASMSFVAALPEGQRADCLEQAAALVDAGTTPGELLVQVVVGLTSLA